MDRDGGTGFLAAATFVASTLLGGSGQAAGAPRPGGLARGPDLGFRLVARGDGSGAEVRGLRAGTAAEIAGLREGDVVTRLDGAELDAAAIARARHELRTGARVTLEIERGATRRRVAFAPPPLPEESIPGCVVEYGAVTSPRGYRVRTIVTRPQGATGRLPAILFVPWLSCDPVESPLAPARGLLRHLEILARQSGWVVMRVEKPGVGDSEGPDCSSNDLETDLDAFRSAHDALRRMDFVDTTRIVLFGGSIGGAIAPVLALERPVAGLVVAGTFSRTWFEHLLEIERQRLTLSGTPPGDLSRALRGLAEFHALFLGQRLTPREVMTLRPELAPLWYDSPDGLYGRPAAYFHQVARLDVEAAWSRLDVPVLVLYGEYDWIMSRAEHEHLANLVNARHPGRATLEVLPRHDHDLDTYRSLADAFQGRDPGFDESVAPRIASWLDARIRRSE